MWVLGSVPVWVPASVRVWVSASDVVSRPARGSPSEEPQAQSSARQVSSWEQALADYVPALLRARSATRAAAIAWPTRLRPPIRWRTLGTVDRMRDPTPAARTTTTGAGSAAAALARERLVDLDVHGGVDDGRVLPARHDVREAAPPEAEHLPQADRPARGHGVDVQPVSRGRRHFVG